MKKKLLGLSVYGFALAAMTYAIWQADISILPVASAAWPNGCCLGSNDCGGNKICWPKPQEWEACFVGRHYDPDCNCMVVDVVLPNYCNPPGQPPGGGGGKGPGDILD